ncbi:hypothetical protein J6590_091477 [Homalodisca vitripennis]|nr:hypothetical protein J6590_091477 [Homalodisca vitripennis]
MVAPLPHSPLPLTRPVLQEKAKLLGELLDEDGKDFVASNGCGWIGSTLQRSWNKLSDGVVSANGWEEEDYENLIALRLKAPDCETIDHEEVSKWIETDNAENELTDTEIVQVVLDRSEQMLIWNLHLAEGYVTKSELFLLLNLEVALSKLPTRLVAPSNRPTSITSGEESPNNETLLLTTSAIDDQLPFGLTATPVEDDYSSPVGLTQASDKSDSETGFNINEPSISGMPIQRQLNTAKLSPLKGEHVASDSFCYFNSANMAPIKDRVQKHRDQMKKDPEKWEAFKQKERDRDRLRRLKKRKV